MRERVTVTLEVELDIAYDNVECRDRAISFLLEGISGQSGGGVNDNGQYHGRVLHVSRPVIKEAV